MQGLKEWRVINVAATKESVAPRCVYAIGCPDAFGDGNKIHVYTSKRADSADGGVQTMEDATLFPAELHSRMERSTQFTQAEHAVGIISELECNLRSVVFCRSICAIFETHLPKTPAVDLLDAEFGPGGLHSICFETHNVSLPRIAIRVRGIAITFTVELSDKGGGGKKLVCRRERPFSLHNVGGSQALGYPDFVRDESIIKEHMIGKVLSGHFKYFYWDSQNINQTFKCVSSSGSFALWHESGRRNAHLGTPV